MIRTRSASSSLTQILRSLASYPSGTIPPTHRPLRLEAAILSRMRSEVTSRSNWANERRILSVSRPMDVVVLNCWVTDTNETLCWSNSSTVGKVCERPGQPVDLVDHDHIDLAGAYSHIRLPLGASWLVETSSTPISH